MAKNGLINLEIGKEGARFWLLPFVVGIYENQIGNMDEEMAILFESYYQQAFVNVMRVQPQFHRVVPIGKTIDNTMEIQPYENIASLVDAAQSWAVFDCICRKQKTLIGEGCDHPLDVCMALSAHPNAFKNHPVFKDATHEEALAALKRASDAGLVHTVSNNQESLHYICNCCTCSCGVLRGMAEMGLANVVARSAFVCQFDRALCTDCALCVDDCQFDALAFDGELVFTEHRCVGCGICVQNCPEGALSLVRRPDAELPPVTEGEWMRERAAARQIDLDQVL